MGQTARLVGLGSGGSRSSSSGSSSGSSNGAGGGRGVVGAVLWALEFSSLAFVSWQQQNEGNESQALFDAQDIALG